MHAKYDVVVSSKFKRDLKRCIKSGLDMRKLNAVLSMLENGIALPEQYKDHALQGRLSKYRECHIQPDWLLMYKIDNGELVLTLIGTGSHAHLFGM